MASSGLESFYIGYPPFCYNVTSGFLTQLGDSGWKSSFSCWILIHDCLVQM